LASFNNSSRSHGKLLHASSLTCTHLLTKAVMESLRIHRWPWGPF